MKKLFTACFIGLVILASANAQTGGSAAWDRGEKEMLMGLTLFVRPAVMDLGYTADEFFYKTDRGYTVEDPVKTAKGHYTIRCIVGSEYNSEKLYLTFEILRTSQTDALISSISVEGIRGSTGKWGKSIASTFEEKMYVIMSFFRER